ncbi:MAG: hypothetical protein JNG88_01245 [Phycisphaerales bacterium]|nr:hypothetical protein [Phycisphaerales bacterium]
MRDPIECGLALPSPAGDTPRRRWLSLSLMVILLLLVVVVLIVGLIPMDCFGRAPAG